MKKILIPLMMGMLCSPAMASDLREMVESMGYTEVHLFENLPEEKIKKRVLTKMEQDSHLERETRHPDLNPDDFLHPRVFSKGESNRMIPFLVKLQRQNPTSAKITKKLATTCIKSGQHREALYWYIQTYQRDRSDHESLWNMAALAYQLGEYDQTQKYLKEYVLADPNSAWGRLAKDFLKGRFSGETMNEGFKTEFSRFGYTDSGDKEKNKNKKSKRKSFIEESKNDGKEGIMIIEGKRTTLEQMVDSYEPPAPAKPVTIKDTAKGKSGKSAKKNIKSAKSAMGKAEIVQPAKKRTSPVTTVAKPLGSTP